MKNLKCYRFQLDQDLGVEEIEIDYGSGYVKFSDIKEILNSTPNKQSTPCCDTPNILPYGLNEVMCYNCNTVVKK